MNTSGYNQCVSRQNDDNEDPQEFDYFDPLHHEYKQQYLGHKQFNDYHITTGLSTMLDDDDDDNDEDWISIDSNDDDDDDHNDIFDWILYDDMNGEDLDNCLTYHHQEPQELKHVDWKDLSDFVRYVDYSQLDNNKRHRAHFDNSTLLSILHRIIADKTIIRLPYKGMRFYITSEANFHQKEMEFMKQTDTWTLLYNLNGVHRNISQKYLGNIIEQIDTRLDGLLTSKSISEVQHCQMAMDRSFIRMPYLYFLPETHNEGIPVRPLTICNGGPTMNIVRYLTPLLWSIFDRATNCTRFHNGSIDVIHAIEHYAQMGHLKPEALFVTLNFDDLTTSFSHDEAMKALKSLLIEQLPERTITGLTIDTILELVQLVLKNQFCVFDNGLYQQIRGGASGLPLTMLLTYVQLFYGQNSQFKNILKDKSEFLGRYRERAILTWHDSTDMFHTVIQKATGLQRTDNRRILSIGSTIHFHDVEICHNAQNILESKVYYDSHVDTLCNMSYEPMNNASKQLNALLYRAVRCCSDVEKFHDERRHIRLSFLTYGYESDFIDASIQAFYLTFGLSRYSFSCMLTEDEYHQLRERIIRDTTLQMKLKSQRDRQNQNKLFIRRPKPVDKKKLAILKKHVQQWLNTYYNDQQQTGDVQIKWIEPMSKHLTSSDILINKRPPLVLLTLPSENIKYTTN